MSASLVIRDSTTMLRRQMLHLKRYPSLTVMLLAQPIVFLLLFVYVFGGTLGAGLPGMAPADSDSRADYLVISQLAAFGGVTVRAVRHYHAKGLLPEPERDDSGYRRYDAAAVVELIRIRTLAQAGVPLARIAELLQADPDEFAAALEDIDATLRAEIRERQRHRDQLARLAAGDDLALPSDVIDYLQRLRELGFPQRWIEIERDSWTMIAAQFPERVAVFMADKRAQLEDPERGCPVARRT